jgi:hypothetical protein
MHTLCSSWAFRSLPLPTVLLYCTRRCTTRASMPLTVGIISLSALVPPQASSGDSNCMLHYDPVEELQMHHALGQRSRHVHAALPV